MIAYYGFILNDSGAALGIGYVLMAFFTITIMFLIERIIIFVFKPRMSWLIISEVLILAAILIYLTF